MPSTAWRPASCARSTPRRSQEIWNSDQNAARDRVGKLMKFVPPVVVNGRVYLPNQDNAVAVYGLLAAGLQRRRDADGQPVTPGRRPHFTVTVGAERLRFRAGRRSAPAVSRPARRSSFNPASVTGGRTSTMTVTVPSACPSRASMLTVNGTGGTDVRSARGPVNVTAASGGAGTGAIGINFVGSGPTAMGATESAGVVADVALEQRHRRDAEHAAGAGRRRPAPRPPRPCTWAANGTWKTPIADQAGNRAPDEGLSRLERPRRRRPSRSAACRSAPTTSTSTPTATTEATPRSASYTIGGSGITTHHDHVDRCAEHELLRHVHAGGQRQRQLREVHRHRDRLHDDRHTGAGVHQHPPGAGERGADRACRAPPTPAVSINFVGGSATPMAATESAGAIAKTHWNNATGASRSTPLALVSESGAATSAAITWSAAGVWETPVADAAGNARMMQGYLDTTSTSTTTVAVSRTRAGHLRRLRLRRRGQSEVTPGRPAYSIGGSGITTTTVTLTDAANTNFSSTFTQAANGTGNYVKFTITATGFTITATPGPASTSTRRAPVNAVQIVPAAAPPTPAVSINFVGGSATPMAATESAGAIAKTHWNNATGASRSTPLALVNDSGAATSAAITWSAAGVWKTPSPTPRETRA